MDQDTTNLSLGIARQGELRFAIPMAYLAEVARVEKLSPMLHAAPGLRGALNLRGSLVPIYDLSILSGGSGSPAEAPEFAAILRFNGALVGLGIDQVEGLIRATPEQLQDITYAHSKALDAASPQPAETAQFIGSTLLHEDTLISVLSPQTLFGNRELLSVRQSVATGASMPATGGPGATDDSPKPMLIFSAGGTEYALLATAIQGTVPRTVIEENALTSGPCIGSIQYHGQRAPVLRTQEVTGLGKRDTSRATEIVMLRLADGARVGLAVGSIDQMRSTRRSQIRNVPPAIDTADGVLGGVLASNSSARQTFVICPENLERHALVQEMAKLSLAPGANGTTKPAETKQAVDVIPERVRHLIFDVGTPLAAPAAQILRILRPPEVIAEWNAASIPGVEGVFRVEDGPVLYVDLARRLGLRVEEDARERILLVAHGEHRIGFAVRDVEGIDTSRWRRTSRANGQSGEIVQLGSGSDRRILPALDMRRLAESLCA